MKKLIKKLLPKSLLNLHHLFYAWLGALKYRHPSEELLVIGVTGTSGKSTTVWFLRQLLEQAGYTVGSLSTIDFYIAGNSIPNDRKMTMLGKMEVQKYLRQMVQAGCTVAIVETTSEGRVQHRHRFINYDMMILTNLYPEHIESHGSFEKYKQAKLDLFSYLARCKRKTLKGKRIPKVSIVNNEIQEAKAFLAVPADERIAFGKGSDIAASRIVVSKDGLQCSVGSETYTAPLFGEYNVMNILSVIAAARALGIPQETVQRAVKTFRNVPGRIEFIPEAEAHGFHVIVDYAFEPVAMGELYKVVALFKPKRIIHVFGSTGGGRDISRRFTVGGMVGRQADICFVTNEDPYDDDPKRIMQDVAEAVIKAGKKEGESLFLVLDRGSAIEQAVARAEKGDMVLVTGKGSEQAICIADGKKIPWDDRKAVREAIVKRSY